MNTKIIDEYGDLIPSIYFYERYDVVASELKLEMPLEESKENIQKVFDMVTKEVNFKIVQKEWNVSKYKDDIQAKDYVDRYVLAIDETTTCVTVELRAETLTAKYYYDCNRKESVEWTIANYQKVRQLVGETVAATFNVLANNGGGFYVEEINISNVNLDVSTNYNDDFLEVDTIIQDSLRRDQSGLILLHGTPGTGKTTYIKYLLTEHDQTNFIFIPNDLVRELLQPQFISFLLTQKNSVLVIEDAEKVISSREKGSEHSVVSTILQLTDGLFSDYLNIKVICTFNTNLNNIDSALFRKGRMIAFYEFKPLTVDKTNRLLKEMGEVSGGKSMTVADIYYLKNKSFDHKERRDIGF